MITSFLAKALGRTIVIAAAILLALAALVPALNLLTAPDHALHVPTYIVSLFGKYLTYALLALALDLVWGFCGILSLGHAAFFALGGYAMGMYLMRQIGARGSYGNPLLPDFMVFLNWKELPWFWYGFDMFWFAAMMAVLVPGLLTFVFGWFAFRSRVNGVYLSIITQAMTFALLLAFFRNDMGFGGNNGLTDFKDILGFNIQSDGTRSALFAASAIALALNRNRGVFSTLFYRLTAEDKARIEDILSTVRLSSRKDDYAANLSHGQKQWLEIGMLLAQEPELLLVDEPVAGMTDAETAETATLLKEIARTRSVVVVEHDMGFIRDLGVKVTCLAEGSVLAEGSIDFVSADQKVIENYLGR